MKTNINRVTVVCVRIEQSAENHYQQLQQVQLRTEGIARQEAEAVAEEKAKAEAMLRQATSSSTSSQYLAEELIQSQTEYTTFWKRHFLGRQSAWFHCVLF